MSKPNFIIIKPQLSQVEFIRLAVEQFPAVAADILDDSREDLIYSQVYCLAEYANSCIESNQLDEFKRAVNFVQQAIKRVDSTTVDALYLDFLGCLKMHGDAPNYQAARACLTEDNSAFWEEFRARFFGEKFT
jgi:hypothetical protein